MRRAIRHLYSTAGPPAGVVGRGGAGWGEAGWGGPGQPSPSALPSRPLRICPSLHLPQLDLLLTFSLLPLRTALSDWPRHPDPARRRRSTAQARTPDAQSRWRRNGGQRPPPATQYWRWGSHCESHANHQRKSEVRQILLSVRVRLCSFWASYHIIVSSTHCTLTRPHSAHSPAQGRDAMTSWSHWESHAYHHRAGQWDDSATHASC